MTMELYTAFFGWAAAINFGFLLFSWVMLMLGRDWVYRVHTHFFPMSKEAWNQAMYMSMAYYKISTFVFFIVPYIALRMMAS